MNRLKQIALMGLITALALTACQPAPGPELTEIAPTEELPPAPTADQSSQGDAPQLARANVDRETAPAAAETDLQAVAQANTQFAFDLYHLTAAENSDNLIFSPYSISLAFAMVYAGALGDTETQIANTLHYPLPQAQLHPAYNALDLDLQAKPEEPTDTPDPMMGEGPSDLILNIANALWGQQDLAFQEAFLNTIALNYGAGMRLMDFKNAPDESRQEINQWVQEQTEDRIKDLIPNGAITPATRLVLTNAIYFYGAWTFQFIPEATQDAPFTTLDGQSVTVPMMQQGVMDEVRYASGDGYQAVELPYGQSRDAAMLIILPTDFAAFESSLDAAQFESIRSALAHGTAVNLWMPRWDFESQFSLKETLMALGMTVPFGEGAPADFSGITEQEDLVISAVIHKANITVDEEGTEAAAATAIIMEVTSAQEPPPTVDVRLDKPFLFAIYDQTTGVLLFLGRVTNPSN